MKNINNLTDHFLIAMPALQDPNFHHTVTYICEHNEHGAIGLIINRPISMQLEDIFLQMKINVTNDKSASDPLFFGGPIQPERGFVIHRPVGQWRSSLHTTDEIAVTTSQDILEAMAKGNGPSDTIITLGYSGWSNEQLETELINNIWLSCPADHRVMFDVPYTKRWEAAAKLIGIDINSLSTEVGHA